MLADFIKQHLLPESFATTANTYFMPLAQQIADKAKKKNTTYMLGINGCQGSGKSTLTDFICQYLKSEKSLNVVNLSLDDFYFSKEKRLQLSHKVHPLLATRGVPGTHDIQLMSSTLSKLKSAILPLNIPRFNKATDDLIPTDEWPQINEDVDIVILEGWCWGVEAQNENDLAIPVNTLEAESDQDLRWRKYVNQQLASQYQPLYPLMDNWLMLKAPNFNCVAQWRWQQEQKLAQQHTKSTNARIMDKTQVLSFIQYYQRLTEHSFNTLANKCDWLLELDENRNIIQMCTKD